jgi:3-oxoacyl-[acyl-carrier protein] reductase
MANFLVIAASSGMGQATVKALIDAGHIVYTTATSNDKINPDAILSDASNFGALDKIFQSAMHKMRNIDGVINFAGSLFLRPAHLTTEEQYEEVIRRSLTTAFSTVHNAGKYMNKGGSVVLIASVAGIIGLKNHEAIAAAKTGVIGLMRAAAMTYAEKNLRFNVIAPGLVETPLVKSITGNPQALAYSLAMHPLKRIGRPEDISRAALFLLDPENSWITGQVLGVDGGLSSLKEGIK